MPPVSSQEAVGRVTYVDGDGEVLCQVDLLPAEDIEQAQVLDYTAMLLQDGCMARLTGVF